MSNRVLRRIMKEPPPPQSLKPEQPRSAKGLERQAHNLWGGRVLEEVAAELGCFSKRLSSSGRNSLLPSDIKLESQMPAFLRAISLSMKKAALGQQGGKEVQIRVGHPSGRENESGDAEASRSGKGQRTSRK
jgi:hypothetical protein